MNKIAVCAAALAAVCVTACSFSSEKKTADAPKAKVYFTRDISPEGLARVYSKINQDLTGKIAIKLHTGEPHGPNIIPPAWVKQFKAGVPNSTVVETNVLYDSPRQHTQGHRETIKTNGWDVGRIDIMDEDGAVMLPVKGGKHFKEMSMGKNILNYDSMLVLTHFKGHTMGGYGGSMKNIAIGCADGKVGKALIHGHTPGNEWGTTGARFQENMAESAKATVDHFGKHMAFINVLRNMSVDCDCAGTSAAPVKARDIGILASTDLVAVDQASVDMVYRLPPAELKDLKERIESREGLRQLSYMKELGMGTGEYELVDLDKE